jgi:hypothetical protein
MHKISFNKFTEEMDLEDALNLLDALYSILLFDC